MGCVRPIYSPELVAEAKRQARNFPKGITHVETLVALVEDPQSSLPGSVCVILKLLVDTFTALEAQIAALDAEINQRSKSDPTARRLTTIPRKTSAKSRARCRISSQAGVKELRVRMTLRWRGADSNLYGLSLSSGVFRFIASSLFGAKGAVLHPVAYDPVPGARAMGSRDRNAGKAWRLAA
jgi:hypothetical protein